MTAADFIFPCGFLILVFLAGCFACGLYFKYRYLRPLEWRIARLEQQAVKEKHTTAFVHPVPRKPYTPYRRYTPLEEREAVYME